LKAGTGIKRVTNACIENGNKFNFEFSDSFWITIETNDNSKVLEEVTDKVTDNVTDNVTDSRKNQIIKMIHENNQITMTQLAKELFVTKMTIVRDIARLKEDKIIKRIGPAKGGHWEIIQK
jgi:ATP-dependent DNA helicase RecG